MSDEKKLRVVGWTDHYDPYFPESEITDEVVDAVADAIRKGGYIFGGDAHQDNYNCAPVLSDGTHVAATRRGWAYIMAVAHDERDKKGEYFTAPFDEDMFLADHYYPSGGVDFSQIAEPNVREHSLTTALAPDFDAWIYKKYEIRPYGEEEQKIKKHDYLTLTHEDEKDYSANDYRVVDISRADSYEKLIADLLNEEYPQKERPAHAPAKQTDLYDLEDEFGAPAFDPLEFGYEKGTSRESMIADLRKKYAQSDSGVVCFEITPSRK